MRLYIDEDAMATALVAGLRARGIDVLTADDAGRRGVADEEHLSFAGADHRVLYSFNRRDFARIHRDWMVAGRSHGGLILLTDRRASIGYQVKEIDSLLRGSEDLKNSVSYI